MSVSIQEIHADAADFNLYERAVAADHFKDWQSNQWAVVTNSGTIKGPYDSRLAAEQDVPEGERHMVVAPNANRQPGVDKTARLEANKRAMEWKVRVTNGERK